MRETIILLNKKCFDIDSIKELREKGFYLVGVFSPDANMKDEEIEYIRSYLPHLATVDPDNPIEINEFRSFLLSRGLKPVEVLQIQDFEKLMRDQLKKVLVGTKINLENTRKFLDKKYVNDRLKEEGIPYMDTVVYNKDEDVENLIDKVEKRLGYTCYVKPGHNCAGTQMNKQLNRREDIIEYLKEFNKEDVNCRGPEVTKVVFQKFFDRRKYTECVFDFFTIEGNHHLMGAARYMDLYEADGKRIRMGDEGYKLEENPELKKGVEYARKCLDAIGYDDGLSHIEVFWDGEDEFALVEINFRAGGGCFGKIHQYNNGLGYLDWVEIGARGVYSPYNPSSTSTYAMSKFVTNTTTKTPVDLNLNGIKSQVVEDFFNPDIRMTLEDHRDESKYLDYFCGIILLNSNKEELVKDLYTLHYRELAGDLTIYEEDLPRNREGSYDPRLGGPDAY
ncbi:MAG: hypothetical protein S4CHLAM102_11980 [Chlamydiia bacterium]|nr:hypothetical protein [Chlamydiia bacterium]